MPEPREVGREGEDPSPLLLAEGAAIRGALLLILFLDVGKRPEFLVPFGLERVGHESVVRIDLHVTPPGQVGFVPSALDLLVA